MDPMGTNDEVPVLVVGAGPAGLTTAIMLARHGVKSLVVERHPGTSTFPKATGVNTRTMELVRGWGLEDQVRAGSIDAKRFAWMSESLASEKGEEIPVGSPRDEEAHTVSPTTPTIAPQDYVEPVMLEHLRTYPHAQVLFGVELESLEQDNTGVTSVLVDRETGQRRAVRSRFLVAADGAHSTVRSAVDIAMIGPDNLAEFRAVLFEADLWPILGPRAYVLYMIRDAGIFMPAGGNNRWMMAGPPVEPTALIRAVTGVPDLDIRVVETLPVKFAAQVATSYRKGNTFLVGDAAHRMTPMSGMGMNTAMHDAHNLGWKLAWVMRGWVEPDVLDTYEAERRPIGEINTRNSMRTGPETGDPLEGELGAVYESGALVEDGTPPRDPSVRWQPTARPGVRAPHVWLERGGQRLSTLDLFDTSLTLLTGPAGAGWLRAAADLAKEWDIPLTAYRVGPGGELHDPSGTFGQLYGIADDGAVLVRPDGYVAFRRAAGAADPLAELRSAIKAAKLAGRPR
jgi:putative polyketide hydroxylase